MTHGSERCAPWCAAPEATNPHAATECLSCFVGTPKRVTQATVCVRWGCYHWPLCETHAVRAKRKYPTARVAPLSECTLCQEEITRAKRKP